jgi:hypothetical protein
MKRNLEKRVHDSIHRPSEYISDMPRNWKYSFDETSKGANASRLKLRKSLREARNA